eukprot:5094103-Amphidinium_carterae.1
MPESKYLCVCASLCVRARGCLDTVFMCEPRKQLQAPRNELVARLWQQSHPGAKQQVYKTDKKNDNKDCATSFT